MKKINKKVISGNIVKIDVEAIMVPQFDAQASFGGVGGSIIRSGAAAGMEEFNSIAMKNHFNYGEALITESGGGNAKYLLHLVTIGSDNEFASVQRAVFEALKLADETGIRTIAVPLVGSGIIGTLTPTQSAKAIFSAVALFEEMATTVDTVTLVLYNEAIEPVQQVLDDESYLNVAIEKGQKVFSKIAWLEAFAKDMSNEDR